MSHEGYDYWGLGRLFSRDYKGSEMMYKYVYRHSGGHSMTLVLDIQESLFKGGRHESDYQMKAEITLRVNPRTIGFNNGTVELTQTWNEEVDDNKTEEKEENIYIDFNKFKKFQEFINKIGKEIDTFQKEFEELSPGDFPEGRIIYLANDKAKKTIKCEKCESILYPVTDKLKLIRMQEEDGIYVFYCVKCKKTITVYTKHIP